MCVVLEQINWLMCHEMILIFRGLSRCFWQEKRSGLKPTAFNIFAIFCQNMEFNPRFLTDKVLLVATKRFIVHLGKTTFTGLTILASKVLARLIHRVDDGVK